MKESGHTDVVIISIWSAHGPVDAGDGELDSLGGLVLVEVHILEHEGEDEFPIAIGRVQFLDAVGGAQILVSDDRQDGLALIQALTNSTVPVTP